MKTKYEDMSAIVNVIGNIYNNPQLLNKEDKYIFIEDDFPSEFQKIVFGAMFNLWQLGVTKITLESIEDYLTQRAKKKAIYDANKGSEYILKCAENASEATFDYYYQRIKKMTLLRAYEQFGLDVSWIYDTDNVLDIKKKQEQEDYLDNASLEDIAFKINDKIDAIKLKYADCHEDTSSQMGDNVFELLESLRETPALGYPLYGQYINTATRGARLGKLYLRSAPTGVGKTRSMMADACWIGASHMYNNAINKWEELSTPQNVLFIATEQNLSEVQTMAIAFLSGVDEEHILTGEYLAGEWERIAKAANILKDSHIYFECLPDFSLQDIENVVKKHIREHQVQYAFFDYIHTSPKILTEIGGKSGIKNLREDNILFLLASSLKEICVKYDIFIETATQLNAAYQESETPDQNCLRGSKAIADRIDFGCILLDVTKEDKEKLAPLINKANLVMPNVKLSIYKNRQGRYKDMYLWMNADKSTCRYNPIFATKFDFTLLDMKDLQIEVKE